MDRNELKNLDAFLAFIEERLNIWIKRDRGDPPPWTDDPILQTGYFCNVHRERDKTSIWIAENWRDPHADNEDLFFAMCVARLTNFIDTLSELKFPIPWDPEDYIAKLTARGERPKTVVRGPAYTINASKEGVLKPVHIGGILSDIWKNRKYLRPRAGERLQEFFRRLCECRGMGDFYAGQAVADMKHVGPLKHAPDWHTFVTWGPGSKKGACLCDRAQS